MSPYKVIIAPDSFKESMSAKEAALAIKDGFQEVFDSSTIYDIIPMADGGEGTTEVLKEALNATSYCVEVKIHLIEISWLVMREATNTKQLSLKWQLLQD